MGSCCQPCDSDCVFRLLCAGRPLEAAGRLPTAAPSTRSLHVADTVPWDGVSDGGLGVESLRHALPAASSGLPGRAIDAIAESEQGWQHTPQPEGEPVIENNEADRERSIRKRQSNRLPRALVGARHEDRVDRLDDAVVALDVRRPVGGLGRALGLEADDGAVEPVLAELAVRREGAAVERLLVRVEGVHRLLALDHVVLEHVSRIGVPTSLLCLSKAELAGARSVYSPPERSMPSLESAAASWSKLS